MGVDVVVRGELAAAPRVVQRGEELEHRRIVPDGGVGDVHDDIFSEEFLLERPLLTAIRIASRTGLTHLHTRAVIALARA